MRHSLCRFMPILVLLTALLVPAASSAQPRAAAEALFTQGREAMQRGDYDTACKQFRESDRIDPAVGTKFNIAECEQERGRLATAWELFRAVAGQLGPDDERLPIATARADALERRVPKLTIRLAPGAPGDTTVRAGKLELGPASFGIPLPLDPGTHLLVVTAPAHGARSFTVQLAETQARSIVVEPGKRVAPRSEQEQPTASDQDR